MKKSSKSHKKIYHKFYLEVKLVLNNKDFVFKNERKNILKEKQKQKKVRTNKTKELYQKKQKQEKFEQTREKSNLESNKIERVKI